MAEEGIWVAAEDLHLFPGWEIVGAAQMVVDEEVLGALPVITVGGDGGLQATLQPQYGLLPYPLPPEAWMERDGPATPPEWPEYRPEDWEADGGSTTSDDNTIVMDYPSSPESPLLMVLEEGEECKGERRPHSA